MSFRKKISNSLFYKYQGIRENDTKITFGELQEIKKIKFQFLAISALIGILFVLIFYVPIYVFPSFFNDHVFEVNFFGLELHVRWVRECSNLLLTYVELYFLSIVSIFMIHKLAAVLDFPAINSTHYALHQRNIELLSLERNQKEEKDLGLDPFKGLSKVQLFIMILISRFKAILSNLIIRFFLQRFAGRYILSAVIDMVGMPVYAFWNAYTMKRLYDNAKFYIFSVELTDFLVGELEVQNDAKETLQMEIHDLIETVVRLKREYSYINYYFSSRMLECLKVEIDSTDKDRHYEFLKKETDSKAGHLIHLLFATGIILDGKITRQERKYIAEFQSFSFTSKSPLTSIDSYLKAYQEGRALEYIKQQEWI